VTGAGGGVGLACVRRFARTHSLVLAAPTRESLAQAEAVVVDQEASFTSVLCDVSNADAVAELARVAGEQGPLGALVHTAGLSRSMADGRHLLAVNLVGTALVVQAFLPLATRGSVAVCVSSIGAHRRAVEELDEMLLDPHEPGFASRLEARLPLRERAGLAYDLSKRGVIVLCEREARAWGSRGARIVSLSPGPIDTPMGHLEARRDAGGLERLAAFGRVASAAEVASAAALLCGPDASFVTGCDLRVDGGILAGIRYHAPPAVTAAWNSLRSEEPVEPA
jgi:NAD(P)-dependent dehydrogenase (short-subunit alcohol dehydrogenase family)